MENSQVRKLFFITVFDEILGNEIIIIIPAYSNNECVEDIEKLIEQALRGRLPHNQYQVDHIPASYNPSSMKRQVAILEKLFPFVIETKPGKSIIETMLTTILMSESYAVAPRQLLEDTIDLLRDIAFRYFYFWSRRKDGTLYNINAFPHFLI